MATTIGTAYVQILPTTEGITSELTSALISASSEASASAGEQGGSSFVASMASGIAKGAAAVTTAAAGIGAAIVGVANQTSEYGDTIDKTSQKLGVSSTFYQEWDAVLQHSGASMESMTSTFKTLANASQDASDDQAAAFEKLGLSMEQVRSMSTEDLFTSVISGLQGMEEGTERTALATDLLGKGAMEMGALLNTSAEDTQAMIDRIHELGGVMSADAVKDCAAYQDSLQDMQTAFAGVKNGIIADVIPSLTSLMDGVSDFIANTDLTPVTDTVGAAIEAFTGFVATLDIEAIGQTFQTVVAAIGEIVGVVWDVISVIFDSLKSGLEEIGAALDTSGSSWDSVWEGIKTVIQTAGDLIAEVIGAICTVIAAIVTEVETDGTLLNAAWENIKTIFSTAIDIISGVISAFTALLQGDWSGALNAIQGVASTVWNAISSIFSTALNAISGLVSSVLGAISSFFSGAMETISSTVSGAINGVIGFFTNLGTSVFTAVSTLATNVVTTISTMAGNMLSAVASLPGRFMSIGSNIISGIISGIQNAAGQLFSTLRNLATSALNAAKSALGIHSPSKAFRDQIGQWIPMGIAEGIEDNMGPLEAAMRDLQDLTNGDWFGDGLAGQISVSASEPIPVPFSGSSQGTNQSVDVGLILNAIYTLIQRVEAIDPTLVIGDDVVGRSYDRYSSSRGVRTNSGSFANAY